MYAIVLKTINRQRRPVGNNQHLQLVDMFALPIRCKLGVPGLHDSHMSSTRCDVDIVHVPIEKNRKTVIIL